MAENKITDEEWDKPMEETLQVCPINLEDLEGCQVCQ